MIDSNKLRQMAAHRIDDAWKSSWHWPERDWQFIALEQCKQKIERTQRDLADLIDLQDMLEESTEWYAEEARYYAEVEINSWLTPPTQQPEQER